MSVSAATRYFCHGFVVFRDGHFRTPMPRTLKLVPSAGRQTALARDYDAMQEMFFRAAPTWPDIPSTLTALEARINRVAAR